MVISKTVGDLVKILKTYPEDDLAFIEYEKFDDEQPGYLIVRHRGRYDSVASIPNFIQAFEPEEEIS